MKDQTEPCDALHVALAAIQNDVDPRNVSDAGGFAALYFEEHPEAFESLNRILESYSAKFARYVRNVERTEKNRLADALRAFNHGEEYPAVAVADYDACISAGVPFCLTAYYLNAPYAIFREMPVDVPAGVLIVTV